MPNAIEILMNEHRVIEQVLGSLETCVARLEHGEDIPREILGGYARFFREFADRCHHGKEEDRLFARMIEHGFPKEHGPIAVMLAEHVEGRSHVGAISGIGSGEGPLQPAERREIALRGRAYIPLLRAHIQKEDQILYPMALQRLPASVTKELASEFEIFENEVMGAGAHEELHVLAHRLVEAYPPDPEEMRRAEAVSGCCG
jgi:hemerythrin-like domain-containing protein